MSKSGGGGKEMRKQNTGQDGLLFLICCCFGVFYSKTLEAEKVNWKASNSEILPQSPIAAYLLIKYQSHYICN